jgi:hypothetical protein
MMASVQSPALPQLLAQLPPRSGPPLAPLPPCGRPPGGGGGGAGASAAPGAGGSAPDAPPAVVASDSVLCCRANR